MLEEQPRPIPKDWSISPLAQFALECKQRAGGNDNLPVYSVTKHYGILRSDEFFSKAVHGKDTSKYKVVRPGQFAYATIHLNEGSIGKLDSGKAGLVSPMYTVFEVKEQINPDYLFAVLKSERSLRVYRRLTQGTVNRRGGISFKTLSRLLLHHPPLHEQRKIAAILSSVNDAIEKTQAVIDQVQVVKRGLMQQLFTRGLPGRHTRFKQTVIGEMPEEWDSVPLEQFCAHVTDGTHDTPRREKKGIPLITSKNLRDGTLNIDSCYLISEDDFAEISKRSRVDVGDVLFGMIGTIGNPVVVPAGIQEFAIKNVALFKLDGNLTKAGWLVAYLESPMFARTVRQQQTGNAQRFLSLGFLRTLRIPNATKDERREIVGALRGMDHRLRTETECLASLTRLKSALMSVLLTGELRVTPDSEIS